MAGGGNNLCAIAFLLDIVRFAALSGIVRST